MSDMRDEVSKAIDDVIMRESKHHQTGWVS